MSEFLLSLEQSAGLQIVEWLQGSARSVQWYLLLPFHYIGGEFGVMVILAGVYWLVSRRAGIRLMIAVLGALVFSNFFKVWWDRPRPYNVAPERISHLSQGYSPGLPSGHTMFGTTFGLWFADTLRRPWATAATVAFIVAMGISRMVHGLHYPQDVVGGWLIGGALYALFLIAERWVTAQPREWRALPVTLLVAAVSAVVLLATVAITEDFEYRKSVLSPMGALAGGAVGLVIERRRLQLGAGGSPVQRLLRLVVGLALLVAVSFGLSGIFYGVVGTSETVPVLVLYLIRYGLLGAYVTLGAPWLFKVLSLAQADRGPDRREEAQA
ncbi:MAG: phosphatase PAP2 family protein [Spirochaetaceae bacterium]